MSAVQGICGDSGSLAGQLPQRCGCPQHGQSKGTVRGLQGWAMGKAAGAAPLPTGFAPFFLLFHLMTHVEVAFGSSLLELLFSAVH